MGRNLAVNTVAGYRTRQAVTDQSEPAVMGPTLNGASPVLASLEEKGVMHA